MAQYWIADESLSLRIADAPLGSYSPALGPKPAFQLVYRQRGEIPEESSYFSVGTNWSCSLRAYVLDLGGGSVRMHRGGAGFVDYTDGVPQFREGSVMHIVTPGSTYELDHPDGSKDIFQGAFTAASGATLYFLTQQIDPFGNALTFHYTTVGGVFLLTSVTDGDGRTTSLYYGNTTFPNRITAVVDPFSRTNILTFDDFGYLTNILDVVGISSSFQYDAGTHRGWITNMITPYGSTAFQFGGTDVDSDGYTHSGSSVNRYVQVTLPNGAHELYVFRIDCSNFMPTTYTTVPSTSPLANTLDNVDQYARNSFHWSPLQYGALSTTVPDSLTATDYGLAAMQHWLRDPVTFQPVPTISIERKPSQDGTTLGELSWYDYDGKPSGQNNYTGDSAFPSLQAVVLPDGTTTFQRTWRNTLWSPTNVTSTYNVPGGGVAFRTNLFIYAANSIDLVQQVGPNAEQVASNYFGTSFHQPDASYDALNQQTLYAYNGNRQLTSISRPSGLTTTNLYFASGSYANWLDRTIDLEIARTNAYTYNNGLVYSHTDERGLTTTNYWDNLQRLTGTVHPDGTSISNIYTYLDLSGIKDRLGYWTYSGYNSLRQKIAETNANNVVTRYGYCDCGALLYVTNAWNTPIQQVTTNGYDYQGNRTYTSGADGYTITNWFNPLGQIYQTGDGPGYRYFYYNNQGLRTNTINAYGSEQTTVYDIEDRPLWVADANGVTVTNTYDLLGRLLTRTYPDGGAEKFGYSARGQIAYTNQIGASNFFAYDAGGRKISETDANNEVLRYTNNAAGDLLSLTDGKNQTTKWNYDRYGRVTNKLDQAGTVVLRYVYDGDNRLTSRWSAEKGSTYYTNDAVGNLTYVRYPTSPSVTLKYDALNRLTNMVDAAGTTKYTYTAGNQLLTEDGPFASDTVTNTYVNRLRTSLVLQQPTGTWTNGFGYDAAKRLTNVLSPAGSFAYTLNATAPASPLIKKLLLPNTAAITNSFDSVARLLETDLRKSDGTALDSYAYVYNLAGQRTNVTRADASTVGYRYDNLGQLTVADSSVNTEDRGYFYDAAWNLNRRTNNGVASTFTVDNKNELTSVSGGAYGYDSNGNLITAPNSRTNTYDDENRLVSVVSGTSYRSDFVYDGLGRLRTRTDYTWTGSSWFPTLGSVGGLTYIYDGNRVVQERTLGTPSVSYTRGADLSGSFEGAGGIGGLLGRSDGYSSGNWSNHNFYFADGNGNITYMLNSSQAMVASYRYDPFGNTITSSGTLATANGYRFSSKECHVASGMYYYLYRFYDPSLLRWINRDPIEEDGGINLFGFVGNDPNNFVDTLGLDRNHNAPPVIPPWPPIAPPAPISIPPRPPPRWPAPHTHPKQRCEQRGGRYMEKYQAPPYNGDFGACTRSLACTWPGLVGGTIGALGGTALGGGYGGIGGTFAGAVGGGALSCTSYVCVIGGVVGPAN